MEHAGDPAERERQSREAGGHAGDPAERERQSREAGGHGAENNKIPLLS
jgi:hypothetical protein